MEATTFGPIVRVASGTIRTATKGELVHLNRSNVKSSIMSEPAAINTASATAPMVCHSQCFEQPSIAIPNKMLTFADEVIANKLLLLCTAQVRSRWQRDSARVRSEGGRKNFRTPCAASSLEIMPRASRSL